MTDTPKPKLNLVDPTYDREINKYMRVYKSVFRQIIERVTLLSTWGNSKEIEKQQMESVLSQIAFLLKELDGETSQWVSDTLNQAFSEGQARAIYTLGEATTLAEASSLVAFSTLAKDTVEALIADTYSDLLLATQNTERKVKALVREVVADQMRTKALEASGRVTTGKAIRNALTKKGLSDRVSA